MKLQCPYYFFKSAISPEDCQRIMDLGLQRMKEDEARGKSTAAYTFGSHDKASKPDAAPQGESNIADLDPEHTYARDSYVSWLNDKWLYDMFHPYVQAANVEAG